MSLTLYQRKRNFQNTPEPQGKQGRSGKSLRYVIQKHDATRLHYDFRLELDGTLKSWAVPKGPSIDPADKRLAVHVEDHPLDYGSFEGVIPAKQYGAGPVVLWDRGTWVPLGDAREGYREGRLKFKLDGEKLKGGWALVRMKGRAFGGAKENWLLIKERDETARPGEGEKVVIERPESVISGRTVEEIAAGVESKAIRPKPTRRKTVKAKSGVAAARARPTAAGDSGDAPTADNPPNTLAGVTITHPERVIYPEANLTKLDLAKYYERMAARILPYIEDRPLSVVRCPRGAGQACFFQKHASAKDIAGIEIVQIKDSKGTNPYFVANTPRALVGLAQMGVIELHAWGAKMPDVERPDTVIFDLDPDAAVEWKRVVDAAHLLRGMLKDVGLESFVKTTGGKGLHVVIPLSGRCNWDDVKEFSGGLATQLAAESPDRYVATASKAKREGRIFIDYLRNTRGATAVAPYSLRARPQPTLAMPIRWEELTPKLSPAAYTLARLSKVPDDDAWQGYHSVRQTLTQKIMRAMLKR
jgi:bifunctional non-homologous end joining protein LigD